MQTSIIFINREKKHFDVNFYFIRKKYADKIFKKDVLLLNLLFFLI